jgi:hypothetical protein
MGSFGLPPFFFATEAELDRQLCGLWASWKDQPHWDPFHDHHLNPVVHRCN